MILDFANKGYNIKSALIPLYGQLALAGTSRGLNLNIQIIKMTNNTIIAQTFITNPNMIADQCEMIKAIKDELFTPADDFLKDKGIPSIKDRLSEMCYESAYEWYE